MLFECDMMKEVFFAAVLPVQNMLQQLHHLQEFQRKGQMFYPGAAWNLV